MDPITVGDILERAELLYGERVALVDGDVRLTYREAARRARRFAAGLLAAGVEPGSHVGILANNCHQYWETYFAAHYAGTPLAPLNIRLAAPELEFIANDGELRALIVGPEYLDLVTRFRDAVPGLEHVIVIDGQAPAGTITYDSVLEAAEPLATPARTWHEDDMINMCYTGGTTGRAKGVMLSQRNVVANAQHVLMTLGLLESDAWLHVAPMFHLADAWACYTMSMLGARQVFTPGFTPDGFLETVQRERVTATVLVPTMINFVVNHPRASEYDCSSLRLLLFGASPMAVDRILAARDLFGPILCQAYGMTETAPLITSQRLDWIDYESDAGIARLASCGREAIGVRVRVVDEHDHDVAPGDVGEIVTRGSNVMLGYWNRQQETAAALRGGWMRTGDLGRLDEHGYVYIVDRAKDVIISGGETIYSTEVENALYQHPAVLEAAVIGVPDESWGEAVHAVVVLRPDAEATGEELIAHCHELIAGYKCPKSVSFSAEPLPKSGAGKILKIELRQPYWEGRELQLS